LHNLAHMHNRHLSRSNWMTDIGGKVKSAAEFAGAVKGLYDVGRAIYTGVQTIAPMATALL